MPRSDDKYIALVMEACEQLDQAVFEFFPLPFVVIHRDGAILLVNIQACHFLGWTAEEFTAMTWQDLAHPDDMTHSLQVVDRLTSDAVYDETLRARAKDGSYPAFRLNALAFNSAGITYGVLQPMRRNDDPV